MNKEILINCIGVFDNFDIDEYIGDITYEQMLLSITSKEKLLQALMLILDECSIDKLDFILLYMTYYGDAIIRNNIASVKPNGIENIEISTPLGTTFFIDSQTIFEDYFKNANELNKLNITLVHDDFNQINICFENGTVIPYPSFDDWASHAFEM